jgi:hypothetical protein
VLENNGLYASLSTILTQSQNAKKKSVTKYLNMWKNYNILEKAGN